MQYLYYTGCKFVITPNESQTVHRIIVNIILTESNPELWTVDNTKHSPTMAIITCRDLEQCQGSYTNSYCNIDSLEVYRGREQTPEIGHNHGFSITDKGTIEVSIISIHQSHYVLSIISSYKLPD